MIAFDLDLADGARVCLRFTDTTNGDFAIGNDAPALATQRAALSPYPWTWLRQVHGTTVVTVAEPGGHAGADADASVTAARGATLAVQTADCVPVLFVGERGVIGAAHAGWKGATAGIALRTVEAMRALDCGELQAFIGPAIRPECYEFGEADLNTVADGLGNVVRSTTKTGTRALDLVAGLEQQLDALGVAVTTTGQCTACEGSWYSHRARVDAGRQTSAIWIEPGQ